ncbi:hypothetical protein QFZ36_000498 [Pseudarthrobacter siccitolerans]|uniref:Uncharacterized protein n=1 Tax=Pseudarthrobacter siccitolerans TaxID=861266 RepID=A0ABU0PGY3_9MICC|nr:phage tail tube protein [Pseudarthrobacter siccitolerans]MDQ0672937.1 hypothetical protein [Pseudarthrobacter siccitolerans]
MSNSEIGRKVAYGIGKESTAGTAVAPTYWPKQLEADFMQKSDKEMNESALGVLDKYNSAEIMRDYGQGKIKGKICDKSIGLILASAFGAAPVSSDNADSDATIKDHTYSQSQVSEQLTLTLALKDALRDERYAYGVMSSFDFEAAVGQWATWAADFISKKPTTSAGNTVAYVAENEFKAKHISVKLASTVAGLSGATAISLKDVKFNVSKNAEPWYALGSNDPSKIHTKEVEIKGDFTALFDSATHHDAFFANTNQAMSITLVNTDVTIGAAANPKLVFIFPKVNFSDWGTDQGLGSIVEQSIGFQALYSLTDGYSWNAVLTNAVASY